MAAKVLCGIFFTIGFILLLQGCGRKQRTIFYFPEKKEVRIPRLQFSAPKIISLSLLPEGITISWLAPKKESAQNLVGYNVYRLTSHGYIQKNPLNSKPITSTSFFDKKKNLINPRYVVRALFEFQGKIHHGPASNIGFFKSKTASHVSSKKN